MMTIPSSPADAMNSPVYPLSIEQRNDNRVARIPLGENRTTLTAALWRLNVARYSTRAGLGAPASLLSTSSSAGRIFGWTIHTRTWLSSPAVASLYAWLANARGSPPDGLAFLKGMGWKSQEEMGLESCHRISSVLNRIVVQRSVAVDARGRRQA